MTTYTDRFLTAYRSIKMSDRAFCAQFGVNRTALHYVKQGAREAQTEWLIILAKHFNFSPEWLLLGVGEKQKTCK